MKVALLEHLPVDSDASSFTQLDRAAVELLIDLLVFQNRGETEKENVVMVRKKVSKRE